MSFLLPDFLSLPARPSSHAPLPLISQLTLPTTEFFLTRSFPFNHELGLHVPPCFCSIIPSYPSPEPQKFFLFPNPSIFALPPTIFTHCGIEPGSRHLNSLHPLFLPSCRPHPAVGCGTVSQPAAYHVGIDRDFAVIIFLFSLRLVAHLQILLNSFLDS